MLEILFILSLVALLQTVCCFLLSHLLLLIEEDESC